MLPYIWGHPGLVYTVSFAWAPVPGIKKTPYASEVTRCGLPISGPHGFALLKRSLHNPDFTARDERYGFPGLEPLGLLYSTQVS